MDSEKLLLRTCVVKTANESLQSEETKVSKERECCQVQFYRWRRGQTLIQKSMEADPDF